jgi:cytochrome b pre-mRNA-processing protein 3
MPASLFISASARRGAQAQYLSVVEQARQPWLYTSGGVPDTLDGRFDALVLHLFLALRRLPPGEKKNEDPRRLLTEAFFEDMDRSMREMGVSDTGVGKRVKTMAEAFYGRLAAYEAAHADPQQFKEALRRNIYRHGAPSEEALEKLTDYALGDAAWLAPA